MELEHVGSDGNMTEEDELTDDILTFNVGGVRFQCNRSTLRACGQGRLARLSLQGRFVTRRKERRTISRDYFFFDRDPRFFPAILDYYRTGKLHIDKSFCAQQWKEEIDFWELTEESVSDCCWRRYSDLLEEQAIQLRIGSELRNMSGVSFKGMAISRKRKMLWLTLEDPNSSKLAKVCFFLYALLVLQSIIMFPLHSYCYPHEKLQTECQFSGKGSGSLGDNSSELPNSPELSDLIIRLDFQSSSSWNESNNTSDKGSGLLTNSSSMCNWILNFDGLMVMPDAIILSVWFLLRFVSCPNKIVFVSSILNGLDFAYVAMTYIAVALKPGNHIYRPVVCRQLGVICYVVFLHLKMLLGSMRIVRVVLHYRGSREVILALRASFREVVLLTIFIGIGVLFFGSAFYCFQLVGRDRPEYNVGKAYWWALITMTTIGYGDVLPGSFFTHLVGGACAIVGIVIIALPVPFIVNNFSLYYGFRCRKKDSQDLKYLKLRPSISANRRTPHPN